MIPGGLPPLNLNMASRAESGQATLGFNADAGVMNINYGNGVSQGGAVPASVWYAALGVAAFIAVKRYQK